MTDSAVERQVAWIAQLSESMSSELLRLTPGERQTVTNCAPWRVRDLAAHVVAGGEAFVLSVRQGLAGSSEPGPSAEARRQRQEKLSAGDPAAVVAAAPSSYATGPAPGPGSGERYLLRVEGAGEPPAAWLITIDPAELRAEASRAEHPADLAITGSAAAMALLIYGRGQLRSQAEAGSLVLRGDPALVDRFSATFPKP
jgi:hypothetical protein